MDFTVYRKAPLFLKKKLTEKRAEQTAGNLKLWETGNGNREACNYVGKKIYLP